MARFVLPIIAALLASACAQAQTKDAATDYPYRTVRIIVSAPPAAWA